MDYVFVVVGPLAFIVCFVVIVYRLWSLDDRIRELESKLKSEEPQ